MINIMNEYTTYTKRILNNYMKYILDKYYDKGIVNNYIDKYIEVRYSNYLDESTAKDTLTKKISKGLMDVTASLEKSLPESKIDKIKTIERVFKYVHSLDSLYILEAQSKTIENISIIRSELLKEEDEGFSSTFDKMLKEDIKRKKEFLDSFTSDTFSLVKTRLNKSSNLLRVKIKDNIKFPELYSDIAIDKARHKDSINEDIVTISYVLTTIEIINNILSNNFNTTYFLPLPKSIFSKTTKRARLLSIIDNEYILEHVNLVITFDTFKLYKNTIIELLHNGYLFTIALDDSFNYCSENLEYLEIFTNILMLKDKYYYKDMLKNGKLGKRIIIVDEVE